MSSASESSMEKAPPVNSKSSIEVSPQPNSDASMEEAPPVNSKASIEEVSQPNSDASMEEAPPPAYDSIFGGLKEVRRQTDGNKDFFEQAIKKVLKTLCASCKLTNYYYTIIITNKLHFIVYIK